MAQEECLCRCSTLYNALNQSYYLKNYYEYHYQKRDWYFSDRIIYTPDVTVIKSDDVIPVMLDNPFSVDVITCAAPFLQNPESESEQELMDIYKRRIQNILETAMAHDVDILILGAFGCGAFHNDPRVMSQAFYELLIKDQYAQYFQKTIFAIKKSNAFCENLQAFQKRFEL